MDKEIEINKLIDEIVEMSPCDRLSLQGFDLHDLQLIKQKISQGYGHEIVIAAMRFININY